MAASMLDDSAMLDFDSDEELDGLDDLDDTMGSLPDDVEALLLEAELEAVLDDAELKDDVALDNLEEELCDVLDSDVLDDESLSSSPSAPAPVLSDGELSDESAALMREIRATERVLQNKQLPGKGRLNLKAGPNGARASPTKVRAFAARQRRRAEMREMRLEKIRVARDAEIKARAKPKMLTRSSRKAVKKARGAAATSTASVTVAAARAPAAQKQQKAVPSLYQRGVAQRLRKKEAEAAAVEREVEGAFTPHIATRKQGGSGKTPGKSAARRCDTLYARAKADRERKQVRQIEAAEKEQKLSRQFRATPLKGSKGRAAIDEARAGSMYDRAVSTRRKKKAMLQQEREHELSGLTFTPTITRKARAQADDASSSVPVHERLFAAASEQRQRAIVLAEQEHAQESVHYRAKPDISASSASYALTNPVSEPIADASGYVPPVHERLYAEQLKRDSRASERVDAQRARERVENAKRGMPNRGKVKRRVVRESKVPASETRRVRTPYGEGVLAEKRPERGADGAMLVIELDFGARAFLRIEDVEMLTGAPPLSPERLSRGPGGSAAGVASPVFSRLYESGQAKDAAVASAVESRQRRLAEEEIAACTFQVRHTGLGAL
tara:strand:+ start:950 stop:2794 length:1845 start_codon:yes stop_codon:yes gene_type:complete